MRRGSLLLVKWIVGMLYLLVGFGFMVASGLLFGAIFFGLHPMVLFSGTTVSIGHGLGLIALACLYGLAAMSCIVSLALLFIHADRLEPHGADRHHRHLHRHHRASSSSATSTGCGPGCSPPTSRTSSNFFRDPIYWKPILKGLLAFGPGARRSRRSPTLLFRRKDVLS